MAHPGSRSACARRGVAPVLYNFIAHEPAVGHLAREQFACGGAGFFVAEQTAAMNRFLARPRVAVVCPRPAATVELPRDLPIRYFDPAPGSQGELAELYPRDAAWLERFDRCLGSSVPIAHHLVAARVALALARPFLCSFHSVWPSVRSFLSPGEPDARAPLADEVLRKADGILVATKTEKDLMLRTTASEPLRERLALRVHVAPGGLNPHLEQLAGHRRTPWLRRAWRRALLPGVPMEARVFYLVGRFVPHKNQLRVLRAFLAVAKDLPGSHLLLVGQPEDPRYFECIRREIASAPAALRSRVSLAGPQPIEAAHLAGDVLVHASSSEAWGRVIDEAFRLGNPALVAALPMIAEKAGYAWRELASPAAPARHRTRPSFEFRPLGDGAEERSLLVDPFDEGSIAAALFRAGSDARWRRQCREYNLRAAEEMSWSHRIPRFLSIWNREEERANGRPAFPEAA
jgi:glycosyltransferase involved in cell wall biosynthesis